MLDTGRTARRLESYVSGAWRAGQGEAKPLAHAATGEVHALISSDGLDFAGALDWGRRTGGTALRRHTLHERALMLKAIGQALMAAKDEFYAESLATGATPRDAWPDIDGGIGTMLTFASKARRELPNAHVLPEGPVEMLSRDGS
ncbi:MAG TPA: phenylacetic acid degradation bifunctional protein PaaZ, partial [Citreicella sp.]|nr:phenylacetic acid degradation bifunctional protein PaaZ [Citreicella sp.]